MTQSHEPSDGLGFLPAIPLAVWGALAALGVGAGAGIYGKESLDELMAPPLSLDLKAPPTGPAAPATLDQLTRPGAWTPELMQLRTTENLRNWSRGFTAGTQTVAPSLRDSGQPAPDNTLYWVAGGLAAFAVVMIVTRR